MICGGARRDARARERARTDDSVYRPRAEDHGAQVHEEGQLALEGVDLTLG